MQLHALRLASGLLAVLLLASMGCREDAESPTGPRTDPTPPASSAVAAAALPTFIAISAAGSHTCALDRGGVAYCWGDGAKGQLGKGSDARQLTPVAVAGGLRFLQISTGAEHTCAIATNERAYCWGTGPLGSNIGSSTTPVAVAGDRRFRNVNAGNNHTCAVTPFDVGFCWGFNNSYGQLGTGGGSSATPARIAGGLRWRRVTAGGQYSCGVTTDDRAYCWGFRAGTKPTAVGGGLLFRQVVAGGGGFTDAQEQESDLPHACGITREDRAYCWGHGGSGPPVAVPGTRRWRQVIAGMYHTCGVTKSDVAFCWGYNEWGYNGTGNTATSITPSRVIGGLAFTSITTGVRGTHTCALTGDGRVYCWGNNDKGQLGDGTQTDRLSPVAVVGAT